MILPRMRLRRHVHIIVGDLLERGIDISRVKEMVGHASVETTARYDRRPEAERRKAVEVLHYPYVRRSKPT